MRVCITAALAFLPLMATVKSALAAGLACSFDLECLEGESCAATTYTLTLTTGADGITIEDISGISPGQAIGESAFAWVSEFGVNLLSVSEGAARYTTHIPDADMSILYSGTCAETND